MTRNDSFRRIFRRDEASKEKRLMADRAGSCDTTESLVSMADGDIHLPEQHHADGSHVMIVSPHGAIY